jgi:hypothetical protein
MPTNEPTETSRIVSRFVPLGASTSACVSAASFMNPEYVVPSGWLAHAPFAFWLVDTFRPKVFVELGTHTGFSFFAVAQAVRDCGLDTACYAVDTWVGDDHTGMYGDDVYHRVRDRVEKCHSGFARLVRATFTDALIHFEDRSIDLLHIDGRHGYDNARRDFESWRPKLSPRAVVLFPDTNVRERNFGVWRFWSELRREYRTFEFLHGNGLGVLSFGADPPPAAKALFEADDQTAHAIRTAYARLGDAVVQREALDRALDAATHSTRKHEEAIADLTRAVQEKTLDADRANANLAAIAADLARARTMLDAARATLPQRIASSLTRIVRKAPPPVRRSLATAKRLVTRRRTMSAAEASEIATSTFFDAAWYLKTYPDVARAGRDAAYHYVEYGAKEGRDPSPRFSTLAYLASNPDVAENGMNPLLHYLRFGRAENRRVTAAGSTQYGKSLLEVVSERFPGLSPLPLYPAPNGLRRVNMVTDSINAGSLFGGVGTAIVFSALLAKRLHAALRILTLNERPEIENVAHVLAAHGIDWTANIEFAFAGRDGGDRGLIDTAASDIFITTSWWSTWRARRSVSPNRIVYILQEDERMFYPYGDERLRCAETLSDREVRFLVNSRLLFDHFVEEGFVNIRDHGVPFEPSFSPSTYFPEENRRSCKSNFFFYARPNNLRNLYFRGLEAISAAALRGVLDPEQWRLHIVGKDLANITFPPGFEVSFLQNLDWSAYARLLRTMDLGLALMYTPHPSYPPLDLVASGAVAVTNRHGRKRSLEEYSRNILCSDLGVDSLVHTLADGVALAKDSIRRFGNFRAQGLCRDWHASLARALDSVVDA